MPSPVAVPALPDTERRVAYAPTASTGPFAVPFAIYGDGTDYDSWIEVWLNGVLLTATSQWVLTIPSGSLATVARPITNASVSLILPATGTLQIVGARRPRRTSQFAENRGVAARDLNQLITDVVAQNRETWDKLNDVTGRALLGRPGESLSQIPTAANRAGLVATYDSNAQPSALSAAALSLAVGLRGTVNAASTANINLAAPGATIDGVTMAATNTFLAKDQTVGSQNGVYLWNGAATPATRSTAFDTYAELLGSLITVAGGTANAFTVWMNTNNAGGTLGTTAILFARVKIDVAALTSNVLTGPWIYPANFGVVADNLTDDTAALNAMFAALAGTTATVIWPPNYCNVTDTITIGSFGSGVGGPQTHVNIMGSGTDATSGIWYRGPTDREVLRISKCTNFYISDIAIQTTGARGTLTGVSLGGNGSGSGNQTANFVFERCAIIGFHIGVLAGANFGAASEGTFSQCGIAQNDTGFVANDFNSVDYNFLMLSMGFNTIGLDTGVSGGFNVVGGSSTLCTTTFAIRPNAICQIMGFRSEGEATFLLGSGGGGDVTLHGCSALDTPSPFIAIQGAFRSLVIQNCTLHGSVNPSNNPNAIRMSDNFLKTWDTTHGLPLFFPITNFPQLVSEVNFSNNIDQSVSPAIPIPDFTGALGCRYDGVSDKRIYEPTITQMQLDRRSSPSIGVGYLALNHVRQLSEGSMPGAFSNIAPTPGQNLRVTGKFASSATFAFLFKRTLTVTPSGGELVTATVGTFFPTDVGKPLKITNGVSAGVDWYGYITKFLTATTVNTMPSSFATAGGNFSGAAPGQAAVVGADEPDAAYIVAGLAGNAAETFWVDTLAATGFTLHSSNASSTATVVALIVR
jgi:hypothetical protein